MRKLILMSFLLLVLIFAGCGDGTTGNVVSESGGDVGYASGPGPPQKFGQMAGTGHEQACY